MLLCNGHLIDIDSINEPPLFFLDVDIIPTHLPLAHPPVRSKCPVLQAVAALPLHTICSILELIPELHGDTVLCECEQLFAQLVVMFAVPFIGQKLDDGLMALHEA
jgi:hypothetical protein